MKVLFDHPVPFALAHGGLQIQIEQTKAALEAVAVQVDWLRWWDAGQRGDVIQYFGRPTGAYIRLAQQKGMKVFLAELLTGLGSRSSLSRLAQRGLMGTARRLLPADLTARLAWDAYSLADGIVAGTAWEAHLAATVFSGPAERIHVIPNGVESVFFEKTALPRGPWLVCAATLTERKRVFELAQAALVAQTPLQLIGRPYSDTDPYARRVLELVRQHPSQLRWEGAITDRGQLARLYREARGFVLLSTMETRSLAAEEAAACECPLLLSDLPWAHSVFGTQARYCPLTRSVSRTARVLKDFHDQAPTLPKPQPPCTWPEVGRMLKAVYEIALPRP